jgi:hypothetical protein
MAVGHLDAQAKAKVVSKASVAFKVLLRKRTETAITEGMRSTQANGIVYLAR